MFLLENPPRFLFFTGKGGVGKTSLSCAVAIRLARQGQPVLLVSTDPASNIAQVFDQPIGNTITRSPGSPGFLEQKPGRFVFRFPVSVTRLKGYRRRPDRHSAPEGADRPAC